MNLRRWWSVVFSGIGALIDRWQKRQLEAAADLDYWNRTHMPMLRDSLGRCAICARPRAPDTEHCPGPWNPWKATKPETVLCGEMFHHEEFAGGFARGCEVCDPSRLRQGGYTP
jgi:hypothetical protein